MRDINELGVNEGGEIVSRRFPTENEFVALEELIENKLPDGYKRLIQHSNGGHPQLDTVQDQLGNTGQAWNISRFFPVGAEFSDLGNVSTRYSTWVDIIGKHRLPFAGDDFGNIFVLDFSKTEPQVGIYLHDAEMPYCPIAPNFESFIDGLFEDPDMI